MTFGEIGRPNPGAARVIVRPDLRILTLLKHLAGLTEMDGLELDHTKVTDAGLRELTGLKNLRTLDLFRTKVTTDGAKALQVALPETRLT